MSTTLLAFRDGVRAGDPAHVKAIVLATRSTDEDEHDVSVDLCEAALEEGDASGYLFLFAELDGKVAGYACYGLIPGTRASYDLYWIAVAPHAQRRGVGSALLGESEQRIAARGGDRVYVETSSRPQYDPTRAFYEHAGYLRAATLHDYYAPGDSKLIYVKVFGPRGE